MQIAEIEQELKKTLLEHGASLVGFGDLSGIVAGDMACGVSVAIAIPPEVICGIANGPTMDYYREYYRINDLLDDAVTAGAEYLKKNGYKANAMTHDSVVETDGYRTALPYKTVATRAGIGWIGKCALLVTKEYGSAVRLSALLTNAPLTCAEPVNESHCGNCLECAKACPGGAVSGRLWNVGMDREEFFHAEDCRRAARMLAKEKLSKEITLCGKCVFVCPYTKKYIMNSHAEGCER
ncbi:MAG TPA: 4Fe-4S double cluster binding domain-containing protein [Caproicibacter sp.]|nr:4Fe-4S double cluster binding domain-containing protein [Caproicibacter sp.]